MGENFRKRENFTIRTFDEEFFLHSNETAQSNYVILDIGRQPIKIFIKLIRIPIQAFAEIGFRHTSKYIFV